MKEEIIFGLYKDKPLVNSVAFRKKMSAYKDVDASKLFIKITNYQIQKYGRTIDDDKYINRMSVEECKKVGKKLRTQQLQRRKNAKRYK